MSDLEHLQSALAQIADIAAAATGKSSDGNGYKSGGTEVQGVCTPKALPDYLQVRAAKTATDLNPMNAPAIGFAAAGGEELARFVADPQHIAVITSKYWGMWPFKRRLSVSFMESTPSDLRNRILSHLNSWSCGIEFVFTSGTGQIRISRGAGGYYSYLGTDVLHIATNRQTMNLQGFTMNTSESEFKRVIRHEAGHTLGFPHEHMRRELVARIDPEKAYTYFLRTQNWDRNMVNQQVLTPLDDKSIMSTPADQTSIMCYQLPGEITKDGKPIVGGADINSTDRSFAQRIYPAFFGQLSQAAGGETPREAQVDDSEFVLEPALVD